ncbi:MAG: PEGA domain-containing protein [Polyangiales bacterium]
MLQSLVRTWFRISAAALVLLSAVSPALGQSDDDARAKAKAAFQHAVADYDAAHYDQALKGFEEAYRLRPHPLVEVNIANCYDKLDKPDQAIAHFELFLSSDAGSPEQRQEVTAAVERLKQQKQQTGKILLHVTPDGADVVLDQGEPRRAPLAEPLMLDAGKHAIEVRLAGYKTVQRTLFVKGGTTLELSIALEQEAGAAAPVLAVAPAPEAAAPAKPEATPAPAPVPAEQPAPAAPAPPPEQPSHGVPTGAWVTGGLAGLLGVTAIVTGSLALKAKSDFARYKLARYDLTATSNERLTAYQDARDAGNRGRALALTTDILLGGAAVCAVVAVYLVVRSQREPEPQPATALLVPAVSTHAAGLALTGAF